MPLRRGPVAAALLVVLLPLTAWLWVALLYLLQLEARNRLAGAAGESSPLRLALLNVPMVALVSAACLAAGLALRADRPAGDVRRAGAAAVVLGLLAAVVAVSAAPVAREFALLPWRVLTS